MRSWERPWPLKTVLSGHGAADLPGFVVRVRARKERLGIRAFTDGCPPACYQVVGTRERNRGSSGRNGVPNAAAMTPCRRRCDIRIATDIDASRISG